MKNDQHILLFLSAKKKKNKKKVQEFHIPFIRYTADPIDCESDICHLAWIIRDHRHLLKAIFDGAYYSNGTELKNLVLRDEECFNATVSTTSTSMLIVRS